MSNFRMQCILVFLVLIAMISGLVYSWDIAVSHGDLLEFYSDKTKIDTVRFNSRNVAALAYDEIQNMMFFVDKNSENDAICAHHISSKLNQCFIKRNGRNIHGLSYDPVTQFLFFTDSYERSINWFSLKPGFQNNVHGNVLINMDHGIPTDIAVDSCGGYVYWINTNLTTPSIERARFNGSERELLINTKSVSINTTHILEPHSLTIDQQAQKMYWIEPESSSQFSIFYSDLNGKNKRGLNTISFPTTAFKNPSSNTLTVSKTSLFWVDGCSICIIGVWKLSKTPLRTDIKDFSLNFTSATVAIVANYKIEERIQDIKDCKLRSLVGHSCEVPFCIHGVRVIGESFCKCLPGYIGERCDVSECQNYCLNGNCSVNDEGHPECSCNVGYSGARCEVDACHGFCLNNGVCSLNEEDEPSCECEGRYEGTRCEALQNDNCYF